MWTPNVNNHTAHKATTLVDTLKKDILSGRLVAGERLPTQLRLAQDTGLAKSTIARAYQEANSEGIIKTIVGRGSFVAGTSDPFFQAVDHPTEVLLDLRLDYPVTDLNPSLSKVLSQIADQDCRSLLTYQEHAGRLDYREAGVKWLQLNGVDRTADDIILTGGAQHGLTVCLSTVARPGDVMLVEELTYPGVRESAEMLGIHLVPVPMDGDGIIPDRLEEALFAHRNAKVLYTIPTGTSDPFFQAVDHPTEVLLDLRLDYPVTDLNPSLSKVLSQIADQDCRSLLTYQEHAGRLDYREAGVKWLQLNGVDRTADDIILTGGAQHGLTVCLSTVARPGDVMLVEELTYPGVRESAEMLGIHLVPVPMDGDGIIPDRLEEALFAHRNAKVLYTIPTIQNPTAIFTPDDRRLQIADICRKHALFIIEDDIHRLTSDIPSTPYAMLLPTLTFFIGGLSKVVCSGLRVAYVAAPRPMIKTLKRRIVATHWTLPPLMAEIATRWINDGTATAILQARKEETQARHQLATRILGPSFLSTKKPFVTKNTASTYVWIDLPKEWSAESFITAALLNSIAVLGGGKFSGDAGALKTRHPFVSGRST